MNYYIKSNNLPASKNTALSVKAMSGGSVTLVTDKVLTETEPFEAVEKEAPEDGKELKAGDILLRNISGVKNLKIFEGDKVFLNYGDIKRTYHILRLTEKTLVQYFDYYDALAAKFGGYKCRFV